MLFKNLLTELSLQEGTVQVTTNERATDWQNLKAVYVEVFATKVTAELVSQLARHISLVKMQASLNLALAEFRVYGKFCISAAVYNFLPIKWLRRMCEKFHQYLHYSIHMFIYYLAIDITFGISNRPSDSTVRTVSFLNFLSILVIT